MAGHEQDKFKTQDLAERILEQMLDEMHVEPSDSLKERSFQAALQGIDVARRKEKRRKKMKRVRDVVLFSVVTAAALLLVFQFMLTDEPNNLAQNPDPTPTEPEQGVVETPEDHEDTEDLEGTSPEDEQEQPDSKQLTRNRVDRPQTKEIVTWPEGIEERMVYNLYTEATLPFSTYLFPEWEGKWMKRSGPNGAEVDTVLITPVEYDYGQIEILFFPEGIERDEAQQYVLDHYVQNNPYDTYSPKEGPAGEWSKWEIHEWPFISYRYYVEDAGRIGYVRIGQHNDQLFLIQEEYLEMGEAFPHRSGVLYQEWIWTDTGEPLQTEWNTWPTPPFE